MTDKLKIYGDPISGNCLKAKWTADFIGLDYEWVALDIRKGDTRTDEFLSVNPFGQVPTFVLPGGRIITQSNAIIVYLAESNASNLLPRDHYERAQVFKWLFWEQNSHEPYIAGRRYRKAYLGHDDSKIDAEWIPRGHAALALMESELAASDYLVGGALSLADIALVAYTRVASEGGFSLDDYPSVRQWIARVEADLGVAPVETA